MPFCLSINNGSSTMQSIKVPATWLFDPGVNGAPNTGSNMPLLMIWSSKLLALNTKGKEIINGNV